MQDPTFPEYLKQMFKTYLPERSLRSKTKNLLKKERTKLKTFGDRSFDFTAPELWNSLPPDILNSSSLLALKQNERRIYFDVILFTVKFIEFLLIHYTIILQQIFKCILFYVYDCIVTLIYPSILE